MSNKTPELDVKVAVFPEWGHVNVTGVDWAQGVRKDALVFKGGPLTHLLTFIRHHQLHGPEEFGESWSPRVVVHDLPDETMDQVTEALRYAFADEAHLVLKGLPV